MDKIKNITAIIMAGGEGSRFYPVSTPERPKQFINFIEGKSLIRQTFERISKLVACNKIYISTSEKYIKLIKTHLPEISEQNILTEPEKKNTAPALAYAVANAQSKHVDPGSSPAPYQIYNIGNNNPVKLMDFINALEMSLDKKAEKKFFPMQPGDVSETYADVANLAADAGFSPSTPVEKGIKNFVEWYLQSNQK